MSIRDKFKKLAAQKGSRRDFVKLANREGLTDKTEPRKRLKNNRYTKAFAKASTLDLEGPKKTSVFRKLYGMKKYTPFGIIASSLFDAKPANADEIAKATDIVAAMQAAHEIYQAANNIAITQEDRLSLIRRMV